MEPARHIVGGEDFTPGLRLLGGIHGTIPTTRGKKEKSCVGRSVDKD